ncbi:tRNA delta(2)-isopentenylpyrophosphate transferase [unidentified eubacterium SCB49]|nr:tRNA delta(2)-isopentenylpyrophosphate transferase [unidentified eubacterium SCB49]
MIDKKPTLLCVVGATAIGKTALAIKLAQHFSAEILSADSRQFYKEMKIGTAAPTPEELSQATHHFVHNKSIHDTYTVGDFEKEAIQFLTSYFKSNEYAILVGGSGLYIDAVVCGLNTFPEVKEGVRESLEQRLKNEGIETLQKELKEKDLVYFNSVDIKNPRRLIRALEVIKSSGKPYSSFRKGMNTQREFNTIFIGLDADRSIIYDRINRRVDIMVEEGLIEEAKKLYKFKELNALQTVGYRELFQSFDGTISQDFAISEIKKNSRRFAKRQGTWFKKNEEISWYDYLTPAENIIQDIIKKAP